MKFKTIIIESLIDEIGLSKHDKAVLRAIHSVQGDTHTMYDGKVRDLNVDEKIIKIKNMMGINDIDYLYKMWVFYKQNSDVLFTPTDINTDMSYTTETYYEDTVADALMLSYFVENYVGKDIGHGWIGNLTSGDLEDNISEEMYSMEFYNENYVGSIFVTMLPEHDNRYRNLSQGEIGIDMLTYDHDFGAWLEDKGLTKWEDTVINEKYVQDPPKDLSDASLKKYFGEVIGKVQEVINEQWWKYEKYYNNRD
jgi:hypothetical protein